MIKEKLKHLLLLEDLIEQVGHFGGVRVLDLEWVPEPVGAEQGKQHRAAQSQYDEG